MIRLNVEKDGVSASVECLGRSSFWPNKLAYRWTFTDVSDGKTLATGDDLEVTSYHGLSEALVTLLDFFQAWAEGGDESETADLFPSSLRGLADWDEWATDALLCLKDDVS